MGAGQGSPLPRTSKNQAVSRNHRTSAVIRTAAPCLIRIQCLLLTKSCMDRMLAIAGPLGSGGQLIQSFLAVFGLDGSAPIGTTTWVTLKVSGRKLYLQTDPILFFLTIVLQNDGLWVVNWKLHFLCHVTGIPRGACNCYEGGLLLCLKCRELSSGCPGAHLRRLWSLVSAVAQSSRAP